MINETISHYRINEKLGSGGMGEVYKAEDIRLGRNVAIKFLPKKYTQDNLALERFKREAQTTSAIDHPNICTIHDVGEHEGQPFLVMQYIKGSDLKTLLKKAPFALDEILDIGIQVATGLEKAHSRNIMHRDIKPANIIVTPDGLVKILDFGLAKLTSEQKENPSEQKTNPEANVGTTLYMSPEQVRNDQVDTRSDLFSLGVILYEMSTGSLPYSGTTPGAVYDEILNRTPVSPIRVNPDIPDGLEHIILKCLEKDADLRYQSSKELLADLKRLARGNGQALETVQGPLLKSGTPGINWKLAPAVILVVAGLGLILWGSGLFNSPAIGSSVGVLPFENASGDQTQEALADGLSEDIVTQLTKISGLNVFRFKGIEATPEKKAAELGVATLLEGRIRRMGENIRISTQLSEARSGRILWSENYVQDLGDVFSLQRQIALEVAEALEVELLPDEKSDVEVNPTDSVEAYNLYLQGRFLRHTQENPEGLRQAVDYFQGAIELDKDYALAWAGLAECYFMLAMIYGAEPWEKFGEAAGISVHFGESFPEPHVAMGLWSDFWVDDAEYADAEFKKALEIDPRHSNARREYARFLMRRGRFDESLKELEKVHDPMFAASNHLTRAEIYRYRGQFVEALEEAHLFQELWSGSDEPYLQMVLCHISLMNYPKALELTERISEDHPSRYRVLALIYLVQHRLEEAGEAGQELIARQPDVPFTWWINGNLALCQNDLSKAREHFQKALDLKAKEDLTWRRPYTTHLGVTYWLLGDMERAEILFTQSIQENKQSIQQGNLHPELRRDMAVIHTTLGNTDQALDWLEQAVEKGASVHDLTLKDDFLKNLYNHPRFLKLTIQAKEKLDRMQAQVQEMEMQWK